MIIYPAIDLFEGKAVRLFKGDYAQMTVYHENPVEVARDFKAKGVSHIHLVDLEGAKFAQPPIWKRFAPLRLQPGCFAKLAAVSAVWQWWSSICPPESTELFWEPQQ